MHDMKKFLWDEHYLYRSSVDEMICHCFPEVEMFIIFEVYHLLPFCGHHS